MSCQRVDPHVSEAHCGYTSFHEYVFTLFIFWINEPVLPDFIVKRRVSFAEFVDVHEDNLFVNLFDAHQAPDEVLP